MTCAACARRVEKTLTKRPAFARRASTSPRQGHGRVRPEADRRARADRARCRTRATTPPATARADFVVDDSARPVGLRRAAGDSTCARSRGVVAAAFNLGTMEVARRVPARHDRRRRRSARPIEAFGYRVRETPGGGGDARRRTREQAARDAEYRDLRPQFWVAALLSLPVLVIAMSHGRIAWLNFPGVNWLQLALTTPVVFYCGCAVLPRRVGGVPPPRRRHEHADRRRHRRRRTCTPSPRPSRPAASPAAVTPAAWPAMAAPWRRSTSRRRA